MPDHIIATGGGAKSPVWCQLQADITGLPVIVPREKEAACLGAAIVAAVSDRQYADYAQAAAHCVAMVTRYEPHPSAFLETKSCRGRRDATGRNITVWYITSTRYIPLPWRRAA